MRSALGFRALHSHLVRVDQEPGGHGATEGGAQATAQPVQDDEPVLLLRLGLLHAETSQQQGADYR